MKLLFDTHLLLWTVKAVEDEGGRLSPDVIALIEDAENELYFSAASVWEVAIKQRAQRSDFQVDANVFRRALLDRGYQELPITGEHGACVAHLPPVHKDPFDRILVAQAIVEGFTLLTVDATISHYPGPVRRV